MAKDKDKDRFRLQGPGNDPNLGGYEAKLEDMFGLGARTTGGPARPGSKPLESTKKAAPIHPDLAPPSVAWQAMEAVRTVTAVNSVTIIDFIVPQAQLYVALEMTPLLLRQDPANASLLIAENPYHYYGQVVWNLFYNGRSPVNATTGQVDPTLPPTLPQQPARGTSIANVRAWITEPTTSPMGLVAGAGTRVTVEANYISPPNTAVLGTALPSAGGLSVGVKLLGYFLPIQNVGGA